MPNNFMQAFQPIRESSAPSFDTTSGNANKAYGLASTDPLAIGSTSRRWNYPGSRVIRVASKAGDDLFIALGSSLAVATVDGTSMLVLGGTAEIIRVQAGQTHIAVAASTDVVLNVTLGYGQ